MPADQSIRQRAAALREIGWFADRAESTEAELGDEIAAAMAETLGEAVGPDDPYLELLVAEQDPSRVWWSDLEADVSDGNGVYVATLQEWAAISSGAFAPSEIEETWASEVGPVTVAFELAGTRHELHPTYLEDWIDPMIATSINELIARSARRFEFVEAFDQTAFVVALTADEKAALEDRGWCFE